MSEFGVESPSRCDESVSQSVADATGRGVRGGAPMAVPWPNFFGSVGISARPLQGIKGTYKGAPPTCYIAVVAAAAPAAARAG